MAKYYLYKNAQIINIIEAEKSFVDMLIQKGEIDAAVSENSLLEPKSLEFDPIKKIYKESQINIPASNPDIRNGVLDNIDTSVTDIKAKITSMEGVINTNHAQIASYITTNNTQVNDIQNAFQAVKGYLLLVPELQKQLNEIKLLLEAKNTN